MDNNLLTSFAKKVQEMRTAQTEYFKSRKMNLQTVSNDWLNKSRRLEREVDELAKQIVSGGVQGKLM